MNIFWYTSMNQKFSYTVVGEVVAYTRVVLQVTLEIASNFFFNYQIKIKLFDSLT